MFWLGMLSGGMTAVVIMLALLYREARKTLPR